MDQDMSTMNFPLQSFVCPHSKFVYTFYRQGQALQTSMEDTRRYKNQTVTFTNDLGNVYLIDEAYKHVQLGGILQVREEVKQVEDSEHLE